MHMDEVAARSGFSVSQARRRIEALTDAGLVQRRRVKEEKNRWDYDSGTPELLLRLVALEKVMRPAEALSFLAREVLGASKEEALSMGQILELLREERQARKVRDTEIAALQAKVAAQREELRKRRLPVEVPAGRWRGWWRSLRGWFAGRP